MSISPSSAYLQKKNIVSISIMNTKYVIYTKYETRNILIFVLVCEYLIKFWLSVYFFITLEPMYVLAVI